MIKALIDTNVVLDIALNREPFFEYSSKIFDKIDDQILEGFITASSITDIYYIASKQKDRLQARKFLINLIQILEVVGVDKDIVIQALESEITDFEDAIQVFSAKSNSIDLVITRNVADFASTGMKALTPQEFIQNFEIPR
ncbi:MAG: PIN domain-containing protein [Prolixibacteraceae bacterium]|nr:PIN domain-containing protein [Prolixibacteraceae bacterium]